MAKPKSHYYLIDNLDANRAEIITRGLKAVSSITGVSVKLSQGIVEVVSASNPDVHMKMACDVAGTVMRTKIKKSQLY
jgi:hypothetical protein